MEDLENKGAVSVLGDSILGDLMNGGCHRQSVGESGGCAGSCI